MGQSSSKALGCQRDLPVSVEPTPKDEEDSPVMECAICFDNIAQSTCLPCACKVSFCFQCWDRALAHSFNACGQARCPTCRGSVRVDFNPDLRQLVFSPDDEDEAPAAEDSATGAEHDHQERHQQYRLCQERQLRARNRLRDQARPAQARLLQIYGEENPRKASASFTETQERARGPSCVCGSTLELVSSTERTRRLCQRLVQHPPGTDAFERVVNVILNSGQSWVLCDLCSDPVASPAPVWTCQNGNLTILHANAYDVCQTCFGRYAWGEPPGQAALQGHRLEDNIDARTI